MFTYSMTFEVWTEENIEFGETDNKGWEEKESPRFETLAELAKYVNHISWEGWSSSHPQPGDWITSSAEVDFRTGDRTCRALFVKSNGNNLSADEMAELSALMAL